MRAPGRYSPLRPGAQPDGHRADISRRRRPAPAASRLAAGPIPAASPPRGTRYEVRGTRFHTDPGRHSPRVVGRDLGWRPAAAQEPARHMTPAQPATSGLRIRGFRPGLRVSRLQTSGTAAVSAPPDRARPDLERTDRTVQTTYAQTATVRTAGVSTTTVQITGGRVEAERRHPGLDVTDATSSFVNWIAALKGVSRRHSR